MRHRRARGLGSGRFMGRLTLAAVLLGVAIGGCTEAAPPVFTGEAAWSYLVRQCDYGPRTLGSAAHDSTLQFIAEHLRSRGAAVTLQRFRAPDPYGDDSLTVTNVIGSYSPERGRRVLLAAHYDSRPWADQERIDSLKTKPVLGANDGASGVAVLLELADLMADRPPQSVGVDLVFFDAEDYGKIRDVDNYLIGSRYFAAHLREPRPECGVLLDMVGAKDAQIRQEGYSLDMARDLTERLFDRAAELGLNIFVRQRYQAIYDDHVPLLRAGVPMVDLIGLPYAYWHTTGDTPDKCSAESLRQTGVLITDFIYRY